jgi:hypothetical protein
MIGQASIKQIDDRVFGMSVRVGTFRAWSEIDGSRLGWLAHLCAAVLVVSK